MLNWRDLTVALRFWRRELADRKAAQEQDGEEAGSGSSLPPGPPRMGFGKPPPQWLLDRLPLERNEG